MTTHHRVFFSLCNQVALVLRTVRACTSATIGVVTECMNVHAALSIGIVAVNLPCDGGWAGFGGLLEGDGTSDLGVTTEDGNCAGEYLSARSS